MKKVSLLIFHQDYQNFLENLRDKGVVHIHENQQRSAEDKNLQAKLSLMKQTGELMMRFEARPEVEKPEKVKVHDSELIEYFEKLFSQKEQAEQKLASLKKDYSLYQPWGNFSRSRIKKLQYSGWQIGFYTVQGQKYDPAWEEEYNAMPINEHMGQILFITLTPVDTEVKIDAEPFHFPAQTADELDKNIRQLEVDIKELDDKLNCIAKDAISRLKNYRLHIDELADKIKVEDAADTLLDDKVISLEGWYPIEKEQQLEEFLKNNDVFYEFERPIPGEDVPVLLKNNAFSRLFEPVTKMFALPNYSELDPTPFLAPFFMLFFGLCLGDGGYGLLIILACLWFGRNASPEMKGYFKLGILLGLSTVIVGILTGSFFGIALDSVEWPWLKNVKHLFLTQENYGRYLDGYNPMMILAVALGIIQILYGMVINAMKLTKQYGFKYAISGVGWIILLVSLGVLIGLPALNIILPSYLIYSLYCLIGISAIFIIFMNSPGKGIVTNIGSSLWNTYNMATGLLGDTLSYIRLFALGLTGSILGGVFNTLAFDLTASLPAVAQFIAAFLILILGHTINFGLCLIGAFVHPMRLTFVEFYKNAGFEGGGKQYEPFRKKV